MFPQETLHEQARIGSMTPLKRCRSWLALLLAWAVLPAPLSADLVQTGEIMPDVSAWTSSTDGHIGDSSAGSVTVDGGSLLNSQSGYLGYWSGGMGTATVTGVGSNWTSSNEIYVGRFGSGTLNIEAGGAVNSTYGRVGDLSGSTGAVTVTGAGSKWANSNYLYVGRVGSGTLTIGAGGEVSSLVGYIGDFSGSLGAAIVTGADSKWTNSNSLYVGPSGSGKLTVSDGGEVVTQSLFASLSDLHGDGTITAAGAILDVDFVFDAANGTSQSFAFGSGGTLNVNASGGDLGAGYKQSGSLIISEKVNVSSHYGYLGYSSGSAGAATVTGAGSIWTNDSHLYIGNSGSGTLTIEAGGVVSNTWGNIGFDSGSSGTATVTGVGSKWNNLIDLSVGRSGNGTLIIETGGEVSNSSGYLGYSSGSTGVAKVTGVGSKWTNLGELCVGRSGNGMLTIEAGGAVSSGTINIYSSYIGSGLNATGKVTVTGAGSKWTNNGNLTVGFPGKGELTIADGGLVSVRKTILIDTWLGASSINIATGGMLALYGNADDTLSQFLALVQQGAGAIRFWDDSLSEWAPLVSATFGEDYTLKYLSSGDLAGYTLLTVGEAISPGLAGDFNADGSVDGADFLAWQRGESPDPLGEGDLIAWKTNFGASAFEAGSSVAVAASVSVPEPTTGALALLIPLAGLHCRAASKKRRSFAAS